MTLNEKIMLKNLIKDCLKEEWEELDKEISPQSILDSIVWKRQQDIIKTLGSELFLRNLEFFVSPQDDKPFMKVRLVHNQNGVKLGDDAHRLKPVTIENIDKFVKHILTDPRINPNKASWIKDPETFKQILREIDAEFQQRLVEAKTERAEMLELLKEYIIIKAQQDAKTNDKKKKSLFFRYYDGEDVLYKLLKELQNNNNLFTLIRNEKDLKNILIKKEIQKIYDDELNKAKEEIQKEKIENKRGRGTIDSYWTDTIERKRFLDWLYDKTDNISVMVSGKEGEEKLFATLDRYFFPYFENNITIRDGGIGMESWVLHLTPEARRELEAVMNKIAKQEELDDFEEILSKFIDWEISKFNGQSGNKSALEDETNWKDSYTWTGPKKNDITGNNIVKDLVFHYGFEDKLKKDGAENKPTEEIKNEENNDEKKA